MESALFWILLVLYGLWLLLTVVAAVGHRILALMRVPLPVWALVPNWNLFAPKPGVTDHYVLFRDQRGSAEPSPWQVAYGPEARKWFHGLWNPNKVQAKAVFDLVKQLSIVIMEMEKDGEEKVLQSAPYLHILHFVKHLPRPEAKDQTQFCIIVREPAYQYEATLLVSPFYSL